MAESLIRIIECVTHSEEQELQWYCKIGDKWNGETVARMTFAEKTRKVTFFKEDDSIIGHAMLPVNSVINIFY